MTTKLEIKNQPELQTINAIVKPYFEALTLFLREQTKYFEPEIREMVTFALENPGKRIRPTLAFLSGRSCCKSEASSKTDLRLIRIGAILEMVHVATLVHDDVLDNALLRHSQPTVNQKFNTSVAILLGDALFAQALRLASEFPTVEVCRIISEATRRVCSGEIYQNFHSFNADLSIEEYFRIIDLKTAELFSVSCFLGALITEKPKDYQVAASKLGRHLGLAYQIFDDLGDFLGNEGKMGKTLGSDFSTGKFTLPLILLLASKQPTERAKILQEIARKEVNIEFLRAAFQESNTLNQVLNYFQEQIDLAQSALTPFESDSSVEPLYEILNAIERKMKLLVNV